MGEFKSGTWIVGLAIYFFVFFVIVLGVLSAGATYGLDTTGISVTDPGFQTVDNNPTDQLGTCSGSGDFLCFRIDHNETCNSVLGCAWETDSCTGVILEQCGNFDDNQSICNVIGCTYTDYAGVPGAADIDPSSSFDWSAVKDTITFMTGFNASIGIPAAFLWIFSFLFFWIPFFALLWAIYMALPFLH